MNDWPPDCAKLTLVQVFRHARASQTRIIRVVAGLVNRRIQVTPLKTYAAA